MHIKVFYDRISNTFMNLAKWYNIAEENFINFIPITSIKVERIKIRGYPTNFKLLHRSLRNLVSPLTYQSETF